MEYMLRGPFNQMITNINGTYSLVVDIHVKSVLEVERARLVSKSWRYSCWKIELRSDERSVSMHIVTAAVDHFELSLLLNIIHMVYKNASMH